MRRAPGGPIRGRLRRGLAFAWVALAAVVWAPAAWSADSIEIDVMVSQISNEAGSIDSRAGRLHEKLSKEFRYESLRVVKTQKMRLGIDQVGKMKLPNGRQLQVKPLVVDGDSALLAVDLEGALRSDLRVKSDQLVVIGAHRHGDGKLVVSLEPHF